MLVDGRNFGTKIMTVGNFADPLPPPPTTLTPSYAPYIALTRTDITPCSPPRGGQI